MLWRCEYCGCCFLFDDLVVLYYEYFVGDGVDYVEVVGDEDYCQLMFFLQLGEQVQYMFFD